MSHQQKALLQLTPCAWLFLCWVLQGSEADCWSWWRKEPLDCCRSTPGPGVPAAYRRRAAGCCIYCLSWGIHIRVQVGVNVHVTAMPDCMVPNSSYCYQCMVNIIAVSCSPL
jgi:hypothetical protein